MHEKTLSSNTVFAGRLLKLDVLDVQLDSGARGTREIVRHPGAAVVAPQLPDGRFVLVRQFRKPLEKVMLEFVAGTLGKNETPADCAARELREETGYDAEKLTKLGVIFPAPGYTDEALHVYFAKLRPKAGEISPDPDEQLEVVCLTAQDMEQMISSGKIEDAKTLAAWLLYLRRPSAAT